MYNQITEISQLVILKLLHLFLKRCSGLRTAYYYVTFYTMVTIAWNKVSRYVQKCEEIKLFLSAGKNY